jgi:c(7)-type cytochrome triheme protein
MRRVRRVTQENAKRSLRQSRGRTGLAVVVTIWVGAVAAVPLAAGTPAIIVMQQPDVSDEAPVLFKHWKHQRAYKCYSCHPGIFPQWEKTLFDHDAMDAGKYCGACHDGKVAFLPDDEECEVCHAE